MNSSPFISLNLTLIELADDEKYRYICAIPDGNSLFYSLFYSLYFRYPNW